MQRLVFPVRISFSNPFNKTPKTGVHPNGHYDPIDLEAISDDYLPRTNYRPMADRAGYLRRTPRVSWIEPGETMPSHSLNTSG